MSNTIIGGYNNIAIGTCGSIGMTGSIGTCGSIGITGYSGIGGPTGTTGHQGTAGPGGYMTDWKEDMMKKYPRFTIKTEYDDITFSPTNIIIDNNTRQEYKFKPQFTSDIMNETDLFIQALITIIRDEKINDIFNGSES